jgi:hypothetical protein
LISPPSITKSVPVTLPVRSDASITTSRQPFEALDGARAGDHPSPLPDERSGHGHADTFAGPGDDGHLARKLEVHGSPWRV